MEKLRRVEVIDCSQFDEELARFPAHLTTYRAEKITYHKHTLAFSLSGSPARGADELFDSFHGQMSVATYESMQFPLLTRWYRDFAERRNGWASHAQIVLLKPQKDVSLHEDWGLYYALRDRYHLVLSSNGSIMISGEEQRTFVTGDVFFYPNKVLHGARNSGSADRVHLIFDVLPRSKWMILKRFMQYLFVLKPRQRHKNYPRATLTQDIENLTTALKVRHFSPLQSWNHH